MASFNIARKILKPLIISSIAIVITACSHGQFAGGQPTCDGNPFLQKFGCSVSRVEREAKRGNPDAQYALGYMYYYGVNTVQDRKTAEMWMRKAAAQGQPLAKRALALLQGSGHGIATIPRAGGRRRGGGTSIYQKPANVAAMNEKKGGSVKASLPAYGKSKRRSPVMEAISPKPKLKKTTPKKHWVSPEQAKKRLLERAKEEQKSHMQNESKVKTAPKAKSAQQAPKPPLVMQPKSLKSSAAERKAKSVQTAALAQPAVTAGEVALTESPQSASRSALTAVEATLLHKSSSHYTLQLMGSHNLTAVREFMLRNDLYGKAKYYSATYHGRQWFMLIYGDYSSVSAAREAVKEMPNSLQARKPWIKSYNTVQKQIRSRKLS